MRGRVVDGHAVDHDAPAVDRQQARERAQQRGLARAVRAEHRDGLALGCVETRTSRSSAPSWSPTSASSVTQSPEPAVAERDEHDDRHREQHEAERDRDAWSRLEEQVHRERHRLRAALDVAGEGDRRAELAERARPASAAPAMSAGAISGSVTRRNTVQRPAPRVAAASS